MMPVVSISMIKGRTPAQKQALFGCVHRAMSEAFELPDSSYSIRLCEFEKENFELPPPKTEQYLLLEVDCFPGRCPGQKHAFHQKLLTYMEQAGEDAEQMLILLREPPMENWGFAGKKETSVFLKHCEYQLTYEMRKGAYRNV